MTIWKLLKVGFQLALLVVATSFAFAVFSRLAVSVWNLVWSI